jgi:TRAP transporter 4TM/12TM fusion protein
MFPAKKSDASRGRIPWYDVLAILLSVVVNAYLYINYEDILRVRRPAGDLEMVLGVIAVVLIFEAVRRAVSLFLSVLGLLFVIYPLVNNYLPGFLYGQAISFRRVISILYFYPEGIYGPILQMFSTLLIVFLIFGAFLEVSGAGGFFIKLAMALVGHVRGGPAKVAVIASSLFGTINGSSMANAATTGVITIPLMKSIGYKPHFAAAVEAVASNGGQIMPPVMGLAVFLMTQFLGVPYQTLVIAGTIPAILYYIAVLLMVDLEAAKTGLSGMSRQELPSLRKTLAEGWPYLLPIAVLVWFLMVLKYSAETACLYALIILVVVSFFKKDMRMGPQKLIKALAQGVRTIPDIGSVVALAGMLTAALAITGLDVRTTGGLVNLAGGNLFALLILTGVIGMILGMGLPTTGVYVLCAMLLAPALIRMGVLPLAAHFFVLYYGITALITPPICVTAFITANIAGASFMKTGFTAMRLGIVTFIMPFLFIYNPELLMTGPPAKIALATLLATICVILLSGAMEGYLLGKMTIVVRAMLLVGGLLIIAPGTVFDIIGVALGALAVLWQTRWIQALVGKASVAFGSGNRRHGTG